MEIKLETLGLLLVVIIAVEHATATITVKPSSTEVLVGSSTYLNCSTSLAKDVNWYHYTAGVQPSSQHYVYYYGQLYSPYKDRFHLHKNETLGSYDIVIPRVELTDAGVYACQDDEGSGETVSAELIVLEASPTCSSTMKPDGVIGVNSCNIETEKLRLSCSVSYRGKSPPLLEWRNIEGNTSITKGLTTDITANNRITLHLTMASDPSIDGSSYVCQTPKANYYCISNVVKIIYAISSNAVQQKNLGETVECKANASHLCSYRWKWFKGDDVITASNNQTLIPKQPGNFRCEADCFIRKQSCTVIAMFASVDDGNATYSTGDLTDSTLSAGYVVLIVFVVLIVIGVIASVLYLINRRRNRKRRSHRKLSDPSEQKVPANGDKSIVETKIPMEEEGLLKVTQSSDVISDASDFSKLSTLLPYIDKGTNGEVYGPYQFKNKTCAFQRTLYSVSKLSTDEEILKREIEDKGNRWKELDHENIIKFYHLSFEKPALYIFMEFAEGGTVRKALDSCKDDLPNDVITNWALQIARGMEYLHAKDIVHSHLKSAQVLIMESFDTSDVSNKTLKISSYRISADGIMSAPGSFKGMFAWESPESIEMQTFSKGRDIWSYGVTVWEILARKIPYAGAKNAAIVKNVLAGNTGLTLPVCTADLHNLMRSCWTIEPDKRPTFSHIVTTLKDLKSNLMAISDVKVILEGLITMPYIDKGASGEVFGPFLYRGSKCAYERIMYSPTMVSSATDDDVCGPGKRWMELDHQNVLRFYDVRFQNPTLYVVMDYAEGGSVRNALNSCTEDLDINLVKDWATQIADGMNYLHTKDIIHGRLKSAQVLTMEPFQQPDSSKKTLKIASFSLTTDSQTVPVSFKGMFAWMAPETIQDSQNICKASDVWSYGVTVWEVLTKEIPYKKAKQSFIIRSITDGSPTLPIPDRCPHSIRDILKGCWIKDRNNRPKFSDILSRLRAVVDC